VEQLRFILLQWLKEYKYIVLIFTVGLVFLLLPTNNKEESEKIEYIEVNTEGNSLQHEIEEILGQIQGVGKVKVLLTEASGERILYQTDNQITSQDTQRFDTVIISGSGKTQEGLIRQVLPPTYKGAIVICQGADSATIRFAIIDAVSKATGLDSTKITVLKMK